MVAAAALPQGHAVRIPPVTTTPFNDRDYSEPPKMVRGKFGGDHTMASYAKTQEIKEGCRVIGEFDTELWKRKMRRIHRKDDEAQAGMMGAGEGWCTGCKASMETISAQGIGEAHCSYCHLSG